jgi:hypothetical protein
MTGGVKQFVKSDSVSVKQIKELYIIPPANCAPMFNKLLKEMKDLKQTIKLQHAQIQELASILKEKSSYKLSRSEAQKNNSSR